MLISVVQEASGMCCPLCREIACGNLFPAQQVNMGEGVGGEVLSVCPGDTPYHLSRRAPPPLERRAVFPRL